MQMCRELVGMEHRFHDVARQMGESGYSFFRLIRVGRGAIEQNNEQVLCD